MNVINRARPRTQIVCGITQGGQHAISNWGLYGFSEWSWLHSAANIDDKVFSTSNDDMWEKGIDELQNRDDVGFT